MSLLRGIKRAGTFWAPQVVHLLRQASVCSMFVLVGVKLGLAHRSFFSSPSVDHFLWDSILAFFLIDRGLAAWQTRGRSPRRGFEVIPIMEQGNDKSVPDQNASTRS